MSEVFENDIDKLEGEDLFALEDPQTDEIQPISSDLFVFPSPLFRLKLEYASESVYATHPSIDFNCGDFVVVPTRYGRDLALVMGQTKKPIGIRPEDVVVIDRKANQDDLSRAEDLRQKEAEAFAAFREKAASHRLEMKLISTHYVLEEQKLLFFFSSENRVDFRDLVKDLVSIFKMRIELRQIGVRDESRITGGLGVCGRAYCCHSVSDKLRPVSIRMAKEQNLSLNSMKISGQCGRLLCCLSYEYDWYSEERRNLPSEGIRLFYDGCNFRVSEVNPLSRSVKIQGEDGRSLEIKASQLTRIDGKWKITV